MCHVEAHAARHQVEGENQEDADNNGCVRVHGEGVRLGCGSPCIVIHQNDERCGKDHRVQYVDPLDIGRAAAMHL